MKNQTSFKKTFKILSIFLPSGKIFLNLSLLFLLSNYTFSQCNSNFTYYSCSNTIVLTSANDAHHYDWYTYSSCSGMTGKTYHSTGISFNDTYLDGTYCISYDAMDSLNQIICTTVITVVVETNINITSSSPIPTSNLSLDLSGNNAYMGYSNFQWYKNGVLISGATNSTYTANSSGEYYIIASGTCSSKISDTITLYEGCNSTPSAVHSCVNNFNLTSTQVSGLDYDWYIAEENITAYPSTSVSGYNYYKTGSTITFNKADFSSNMGSFYAYYIAKFGGTPVCTSGVFAVTVDDIDPEVSTTFMYPGLHLSHNITNGTYQSDYSSYQWYKNSSLITGANSSIYVVTEPGNYHFTANSLYCGTKSTSDVSISNPLITANFYASSIRGVGSLTVNFFDSSTVEFGSIYNWKWYFGDGDSSSSQNPSHTYTEPGLYTVKLEVNDAYTSDSHTKSAYILVEDSTVFYDSIGTPIYRKNQMIVKFMPELMSIKAVDDTAFQSGKLYEFVDSLTLATIIEHEYFNTNIANLDACKIYTSLTSNVTYSISRLGDTIPMPKFWSALLITWPETEALPLLEAVDSLNTFSPWIEYAEPNYVAVLCSLPDDPDFAAEKQSSLYASSQYSNANINIVPAWDLSVGSSDVKVGIYDSGINWDHVDLSEDGSGNFNKSRVKGGWDFYNKDYIHDKTELDKTGHGSMCAGIIGAIRNNSEGIAGIAGGDAALFASSPSNETRGVELYAMKILDKVTSSSSGSTATFFSSMDVIANAINQGATQYNGIYGYSLDIMNNSWGGLNNSKSLKESIWFAVQNNVVLSCASGNYPTFPFTALNYPSCYNDDWVLRVGASDENGNWASGFSCYRNNVDFIAPGVPVNYTSIVGNDNISYKSLGYGTSVAAPHVSGVAALMLGYIKATPNAPNKLAPKDVERLLEINAIDVNQNGQDEESGFGKIDAGNTLQNIRWPRFEVKHYSKTFDNSTAAPIASGTAIKLAEGYNGIAAGDYIADIYEVVQNFDITQPSGRTVLDVWKRNSNSTLIAIDNGNALNTEANCIVSSWNSTSATMKGFIYLIKTDYLGKTINKWIPNHGLTGQGTMALTVYSEDPLANSIQNLPINNKLVRIVPNPSNGKFTLMFTLFQPSSLGIEVTDMLGKIVYTQASVPMVDGHKEIELNLENLNAGVYICNVKTSQGLFSQKISIIK